MPLDLRYATASQEVPLGPFLDSFDGTTAETALTIANTDIKLWKSGATSLVSKNSGGATHMSGGVYYATLDATDTNTVGPLALFVNVSGALPVKLYCNVLTADRYDALTADYSPFLTAAGHTWKFNSISQLTAANTVKEVIGGDDVLIAMDLSGVLSPNGSISTIVSSSFADEAGLTEPTIVSATKRADGKAVVFVIDTGSASVGNYTLSCTVSTSDGQTLKRKGRLTLE